MSDPASVLQFLAPYFSAPSAAEPEVLPDGSRVLFTLNSKVATTTSHPDPAATSHPDPAATSHPDAAATSHPDAAVEPMESSTLTGASTESGVHDPPPPLSTPAEPLVSFVHTPAGKLTYVLRRAVPAGTVVFDERPVMYAALLSPDTVQERRARRLLPLLPDPPITVEGLFRTEANGFGDLVPSLEWVLTYLLMADSVQDARQYATRMPQQGKYAYARQLLELAKTKKQLPDDARAWIGCIMRKTAGKATIEDALQVYGSVCRNSMRPRSPLTQSMYAVALFPGAAHVAHSCQPTVRAVFQEGMLLQLVAGRDLPAGTELSLFRIMDPQLPVVRCLQTAPAWMRSVADGIAGTRCSCSECIATLAWLRASAGTPADQPTPAGHIDKIIAIVEETWTEAEVPDKTGALELPAAVQAVLSLPLRLPRMGNGSDVALLVPADTIRRMCTTEVTPEQGRTGPSVASLCICQTVLLTAIREPGSVVAAYGDAAIDVFGLVGQHYVLGGRMAVIHLLQHQGASAEVIRRHVALHNMHAAFLAFAAYAMYKLATDTVVGKRNGMTVQEALTEAGRIFADDALIMGMFRESWTRAIIGCQQPPPDSNELTETAANAAADLFRLETMLFSNLEPIIVVLDNEKMQQ